MRELTHSDILTFADESVKKAVPVKLFYVSYGRNAWHSTWIKRYTQGCMHFSIALAKRHAEDGRKQGSLFYLKELPALWFPAETQSLFVTEINTEKILRDYTPDAQNLGQRFEEVADYFSPPKPNSVLRLVSKNQESAEEFATLDENFYHYKSYSSGGNYLLGWSRLDGGASGLDVARIAERFNDKHGTVILPVKVGDSKKDVISRLGLPMRKRRVRLSELTGNESELFHNMHLPANALFEVWIYKVGFKRMSLYVLPDQTKGQRSDPGVIAIDVKKV